MGWREFVGDAGRSVEPQALRRQRRLHRAVRGVRLHREADVAAVAAARASLPPRSAGHAARPPPATTERPPGTLEESTMPEREPGAALRSGRVRLAGRHLPRADPQPATCSRWSTSTHVVGVTTNPTIFAKALISGSSLRRPGPRPGRPRGSSVEEAAAHDHRVRRPRRLRPAAAGLRPAARRDGRVSLEVDPRPGARHRRDRRRGRAPVVAGRPAEPLHQDPGDGGRACRRSPPPSPRASASTSP